MNATPRRWSFSISIALMVTAIVAAAMHGGLFGLAYGLQQTITELTSANREFAIIGGLVFGLIPAGIIGSAMHWIFGKMLVTFLLAVGTAFIVPAFILYYLPGILAAC